MAVVRALGLASGSMATGTVPWGHILAFGGDDPLLGRPWYHQQLTREAALSAGWRPAPSDDLAWHAVHIDMYCFDPTWRYRVLPPGPSLRGWWQAWTARGAAVPRVQPALRTLHFLDLFSPAEVAAVWQRIAGGTLAALAWAASDDDVAAARLAVGLGLHAMQDFYAHSSWVDDPGRRQVTWLDAAAEQRSAPDIWSAGHFCSVPDDLSRHGKIRRRPRSAPIATSARPERVLGSRLLARFTELEPGGITLDAPWLTPQTAVARGFSPDEGPALFELAYALALRTSERWLQMLASALTDAGLTAFWERVMTQTLPRESRTGAVERPAGTPPFVLAAGSTSGEAEPPSTVGAWFGLVRVSRSDAADQVVRLGPWRNLPAEVRVRHPGGVRAAGAELFVWRCQPDGAEAGVAHRARYDGGERAELRLPVTDHGLRRLRVG
jgi:hypothetical protein